MPNSNHSWVQGVIYVAAGVVSGIIVINALFAPNPSMFSSTVAGILLIAAMAFLYFLPTIVGHKKSNARAIFFLNLFLGWTAIGWIVAMIWGLTRDVPPRTMVIVQRQRDGE